MKKIFIGLIVLLMLVLPNIKVEALEDSFYKEEFIEGEYIKDNTGKYEELRFYKRSDGRVIYRIYFESSLTDNETIKGYDTNYSKYININSDILDRIQLIAYYGYNYENHLDNKWYVITQYMIWKETTDVYFTDINGKIITKYDKEINEINELIIKHNILPKFHNQTYEVRYNENYSLYDEDSSMADFFVYGTQGMDTYHYTKRLTIRKHNIGLSTASLVKSDKKYSNYPVIYTDVTNYLLLPGKYKPVYMEINYVLPKSKITVHKLDSNTKTNKSLGNSSMANTKFQILDIDNKVLQEKETDSEGNVIFEVGYGNYILKEVSPSKGYLLNSNITKLNIDKEEYEINYYDEEIPVINKIEEATKEEINESVGDIVLEEETKEIGGIILEEESIEEVITVPNTFINDRKYYLGNLFILSGIIVLRKKKNETF